MSWLESKSKMVRVILRNGACKRTKDRVKQYGPLMWLNDSGACFCFQGEEGHLLSSLHGIGGWEGWLPDKEIFLDEADLVVFDKK